MQTQTLDNFKKNNTFEKRKELSTRILQRYTDRCPIIVCSFNKEIDLARNKFIVPNDITLGTFLVELRKNVSNITPEEAIFIFCDNSILVPTSNTISELYGKYKDMDGFLYLTIALENTFGTLYYIQTYSEQLLDNILKKSGKISRYTGVSTLLSSL